MAAVFLILILIVVRVVSTPGNIIDGLLLVGLSEGTMRRICTIGRRVHRLLTVSLRK